MEMKLTDKFECLFFLNELEPDRRAADYIKKEKKSILGKQQRNKYWPVGLRHRLAPYHTSSTQTHNSRSQHGKKHRPVGLGYQSAAPTAARSKSEYGAHQHLHS